MNTVPCPTQVVQTFSNTSPFPNFTGSRHQVVKMAFRSKIIWAKVAASSIDLKEAFFEYLSLLSIEYSETFFSSRQETNGTSTLPRKKKTRIHFKGEALLKGKHSTVYLLVLTSLVQMFFIWKHYLLIEKTSYLMGRSTVLSLPLQLSVPWSFTSKKCH